MMPDITEPTDITELRDEIVRLRARVTHLEVEVKHKNELLIDLREEVRSAEREIDHLNQVAWR
jgi:predicted  nucleic acid-binding Zn-ribbon protein